jgi:hypothetical protein
MKKLATILILLLLSLSSGAQAPRFNAEFYLGFDQILDNREYFTEYGVHQTFFGARVNPGMAFRFDSLHAVRVGFNYMYEFGGTFLGVRPQLDLNYSYSGDHLRVRFGSFPRREVMDYPLILLTDSLHYYRPNTEGASIQYTWDMGPVEGSAHGWVDWMGREDTITREAIHAGGDLTFRWKMLYVTGMATRYHLARTTSPTDMNQIRDDGSIVGMAGLDLSGYLFFDRFDISSGMVTTYRRQRPSINQWFTGWYSELNMRFRFMGLKGSYYFGDGSPLALGDPLYSYGNYARIDLYFDPFKNPRITSKFAWCFHILPWEGLFHSQQVLVQVKL